MTTNEKVGRRTRIVWAYVWRYALTIVSAFIYAALVRWLLGGSEESIWRVTALLFAGLYALTLAQDAQEKING